jgi:hypothetical protein
MTEELKSLPELEWTNIELTGHTKLLGINIKILQR